MSNKKEPASHSADSTQRLLKNLFVVVFSLCLVVSAGYLGFVIFKSITDYCFVEPHIAIIINASLLIISSILALICIIKRVNKFRIFGYISICFSLFWVATASFPIITNPITDFVSSSKNTIPREDMIVEGASAEDMICLLNSLNNAAVIEQDNGGYQHIVSSNSRSYIPWKEIIFALSCTAAIILWILFYLARPPSRVT